jgi:prolipoprotein diacylglyceryltransferase
MHAMVDVVAGALLAAVALHRSAIWRAALGTAEAVANSWREWRVGPVRIISHGTFAGIAAASAIAIIGGLLGSAANPEIAALTVASLVGAALWGQLWVGSPTLLRPFGYFGSVLGVSVALAAMAALGACSVSPWALAAACATAAPWAQAIGRLRCLVQGCCHGRPSGTEQGIRYRHPRSRVVRIADLAGVPTQPTPVYSILANLAIGLLMARLWAIAAPLSFLLGTYLFLAGASRFVEESRRGEPQTQILAGLRIYQWWAIVMLVAGAILTCFPTSPAPSPAGISPSTAILAGVVGLVHWFAMGVDFPASRRRFSRLA